jgi:hypothetical protein
MAVVFISYETKAAARRALTFIVRIFVDDTVAITVWTGFCFHFGLEGGWAYRHDSDLKHRFRSSGSFAMLLAIRRASSIVRTWAMSASAFVSRPYT